MTRVDVDVVTLAVDLVLSVALPLWIVHRDVRRLNPEQLARTWPDATFGVAAVWIGPLMLPIHFVMARRSLLGLVLGLLWLVLALGAQFVVGWLLEAVLLTT